MMPPSPGCSSSTEPISPGRTCSVRFLTTPAWPRANSSAAGRLKLLRLGASTDAKRLSLPAVARDFRAPLPHDAAVAGLRLVARADLAGAHMLREVLDHARLAARELFGGGEAEALAVGRQHGREAPVVARDQRRDGEAAG